jgi:cyclophilin family peptidyl-prolyl cis-trans isomerase
MIQFDRLAAARSVAAAVAVAALVAACSVTGPGATAPSPVVSSQPPVTLPPASGPAGSPGSASGCPTAQPAPLPAGQKKVVTVETTKGPIEMTIEADLSPIAAGNFVALASCGFYDGVVFHRVVPGFVIQGGDPTGTGTGGPGYTIKDEPVTTPYKRGTVAMARTSEPNSVGSQFFIVLDDAASQSLAAPGYNNYQIIGNVTKGMEAVDAIAAAANGAENPTNPIKMDKVTVAP